MPELPDLTVYLDALERRVLGTALERIRVASPFVLRTTEPPLASFHGRTVRALTRIGKRLVFELDDRHFLLLHLMIAGRLHWKPAGSPLPRRHGLAALDFSHGSVTLTEASRTHRAGIWTARGHDALRAHDPGGVEVLESDLATFAAAIRRENHTVKRALTDPRIVSGVGNAYSDEILHAARLSPLKLTAKLEDEEIKRLYEATRVTLSRWTRLLRAETGDGFPENVTAFRDGMAVHGRYRQPCPVCGSPVQRIRHAANEANYCARCQTDGRVLADRSLSRLLREDWPRTLEEWEERVGRG